MTQYVVLCKILDVLERIEKQLTPKMAVEPVPPPPSADATRGTRVVDASRTVWSIGAGGRVLEDGLDSGMTASQLLYFKGRVYAKGLHQPRWFVVDANGQWCESGHDYLEDPAR